MAYGFYYFCKSPKWASEGQENVQDNLTFINIFHVSCGYGIEMRHADLGYIRNYTCIGHSGIERILEITKSKGVTVLNSGYGEFAVYGVNYPVRGTAEVGILVSDSNVDFDGFHMERNDFRYVFQITDDAHVSIRHGNSVTSRRDGYQVLCANNSHVSIENCNFELGMWMQSGGEIYINKSNFPGFTVTQSAGVITMPMGLYKIDTNDLSLSSCGNTLLQKATQNGNTIIVPVKASAAISPQGTVIINASEYPEITLNQMPDYIDMIICPKV
jgi:hypothetical protein